MRTRKTDAVVTGAGRGLGRAIARALATEGHRVWLCSENLPELETTAELIEQEGGSAEVVQTDLSDPNECSTFTRTVKEGAEKLQVVVNNAAIWRPTPVLEMPLSLWSETLAVMLTAPFLVTRDLLPNMLEHGGSVISVSSRSAVMPFEGEAAYCAAKFGVEAFSQCLVLELGNCNVSVNTITPGLKIKPTSITDEQAAELPIEEQQKWHDSMELMPAFVFLARLRGEVTGRRFDAFELTNAIERYGNERLLDSIDEYYR